MGELLTRIREQAGVTDTYLDGINRLGLQEPPDKGPAILIYDIETTPMLGWAWQPFKTNIAPIERHPHLLSFAYTWLGSDSIWFHAIWDDPDFEPGTTDDMWVAHRLAVLFDRADITIAHNGDRFDTPKSNTGMFQNGLPPPSPYQTIDTLKETRAAFKFARNSLEYLETNFGIGSKTPHNGMSMWLGCMWGNPEDQAVMEEYNVRDVILLEDWYLRIRPWIGRPGKRAHPNLGHWHKSIRVCSNCGSENVTPRGEHRTTVSEFQAYVCHDCGAYSRSRTRHTQRDGQAVHTI